jgi:nucleotide-binding universal stress UspA family protein
MTIEANRRTIVVGYDGSPAALTAVETSIDRAGPDGHLVIVHASRRRSTTPARRTTRRW